MAALLLSAPMASARCALASDRTDLARAATIVRTLAKGNKAGTTDARDALLRARSRCRAAAYARGVAELTRQHGAAVEGRSYRWRTLLYKGHGGHYRINVQGTIRNWRTAPASAKRIRRTALIRIAVSRREGLVWSEDPTRTLHDTNVQTQAAAQFASGGEAGIARASIAIYSSAAFARRIERASLLRAVGNILVLERAAHRAGAPLAPVTRIERIVAQRVAAARTTGWSRLAGRDTTLVQHRRLASSSTALARAAGDSSLRATAALLTASLHIAPNVQFNQLPKASFYPWPRDGVRDSTVVSVKVNKPGTAALLVFADDGHLVRQISMGVTSVGYTVLRWDGTGPDGTTPLGPGAYRYSIDATDLAGNHRVVPGLGAFMIARDTTAPTITTARLKYLGSPRKGYRRFSVVWRLDEPLSPVMGLSVVVRGGKVLRTHTIGSTSRTGTERFDLPVPTGRYTATFVAVDGSGNKATFKVASLKF
jgi:hypothetical protein